MSKFIKLKKFDIVFYGIVFIMIVSFLAFDLVKNRQAKQDFENQKIVETYTDKSKWFYSITEIYYFDKHIFCINQKANSITILDENGNCKKEIKFPDNEGHRTFRIILKENNLYIVDKYMNLLLKHNQWNSYEKISLSDKELGSYIQILDRDSSRKETIYINDNKCYKIENFGTKFYKIENGDETIIKQSSTIEILKSLLFFIYRF